MKKRILRIIKAFMDCYKEWHAFVEGFCEAFCFWPAKHQPSDKLLGELMNEHHYYAWGRVTGFICLCLFLVGLIKWLF